MPADHLTGLRHEAAGARLAHNEDDLLARSGSEKAGLAFFGSLPGAAGPAQETIFSRQETAKGKVPLVTASFYLRGAACQGRPCQ